MNNEAVKNTSYDNRQQSAISQLTLSSWICNWRSWFDSVCEMFEVAKDDLDIESVSNCFTLLVGGWELEFFLLGGLSGATSLLKRLDWELWRLDTDVRSVLSSETGSDSVFDSSSEIALFLSFFNSFGLGFRRGRGRTTLELDPSVKVNLKILM